MTPTALNIFGLVSNIIGTIILAFSLNKYIQAIRIAIDAHEESINSFGEQVQIIVTGSPIHLEKGKKITKYLSWIGVLLVVAGFICQLTSYLI